MGYIQDQKDLAKKEARFSLNPIKIFSEIRNKAISGKGKYCPIFKAETDKEEILNRYSGLKCAILISGIGLAHALYKTATSTDVVSLIICLLALIIMSMFYLKYSYLAWRAREYVANGFTESSDICMSDYINKISISPIEILPIKIK